MSREKHHCGCCGGEMETQTQIWCNRCKAHVLKGVPFWEATWYAQYEKYCPFTVTQFIPWNKAQLIERGLLKHKWGKRPRISWEFCLTCGIVKRADGKNRPCRGPAELSLRKSQERTES